MKSCAALGSPPSPLGGEGMRVRGRRPCPDSWAETSVYFRLKLTFVVAPSHLLETNRRDLGCLAGGAEGFVARLADFLHALGRDREPLARVELLAVLGEELAHR